MVTSIKKEFFRYIKFELVIWHRNIRSRNIIILQKLLGLPHYSIFDILSSSCFPAFRKELFHKPKTLITLFYLYHGLHNRNIIFIRWFEIHHWWIRCLFKDLKLLYVYRIHRRRLKRSCEIYVKYFNIC